MIKSPEPQTLCSFHKAKISFACFYKGCTHALLCRNCLRDHPQDHESEIKDITDVIEVNSWVEGVERQKNSELGQMQGLHQQKKEMLTENERLLNEFIQSIIACLKAQKQIWFKELDKLMGFSSQQERELDKSLTFLMDLDFSGDIFEKINKIKSFNDDVLPNTRELIESFQNHFERCRMDKEKIEGYKVELTEVIQRLSLKAFLVLEPFRSLKISEEQLALEREYTEFRDNTRTQVESLNQMIENVENENMRLQLNLNEVNEAKRYLEDDYQTEVNRLRNQFAKFEGLLELEDSKIIKTVDFDKLKEWIPKPLNSNTRLRLLYRASRDGWNAKSFHLKCDGITPTVSVIKSKKYGKVFGGYTTQNWGRNARYVEDQDAFIFSLTHGEKYSCTNPSQAIFTSSEYLVVFGGGVTGDIYLCDSCNTEDASCIFPNSYACPRFSSLTSESQAYFAGAERFKIEELEVYQIIFV